MKPLFSILLGLSALTIFGVDSGYGNQIEKQYLRKNVSFAPSGTFWRFTKKDRVEFENGVLTLMPKADGSISRASCVLGSYSTGDAYRVTFEYRSQKPFTVHLSVSSAEYRSRHLSGSEHRVPASAEWKKFSTVMKVPPMRHSTRFFILGCKDGNIEIRNPEIVEQEPADAASGRSLVIDGKKCPAIYWSRSNEAGELNDREAAQMFRFALRRCGGRLLPIREARTAEDFKSPGLFIGKAAEKAGFQFGAYGKGGFSGVSAPGRVGISGHLWGGVHLGALYALEKIGIRYLSEDNFRFPAKGDFQLSNWKQTLTPALPIRSTESRAGRYLLKGYTPARYTDYSRYVDGLGGHSGASLLPATEFAAKHPEYYALQENGNRLLPKGPGDTHYCLTHPDVIRIFADRLKEIMRCTPSTFLYSVYDGDGANLYCRCTRCKAVGTPTDLYIHFANEVGKITTKEFPDKYLMTISYVDTFNPPTRVRPDRNTLIGWCAYSSVAWGAQNNYVHLYNETGRKNLQDWTRISKGHMFFFAHPVNYREMLNVHPKHLFNNTLVRYAARNGWLGLSNCFYVCTYSNGSVPGSNSFHDLGMYLQTWIAIDPSVDEKKLAAGFIRDYYGPAAGEMQQYYDLIEAEPVRRNWAQGCEELKRGFITPDLAEKCLKLLDAAEKKAGNGPFRMYVMKEKIPFLWTMLTDICRGQANITRKNFPQYATRLAEFCRLCQERGIGYMNRPNYAKTWFQDCHLLKIGNKPPWYKDSMVQQLMKDPVAVLGATIPNVQKITPEGIVIGVDGFAGGIKSRQCGWMRQTQGPAVCLRRISSTFGVTQTTLCLTEPPKGPVRMVINGIDDEKKAKTTKIEILINGKRVFTGFAPFEKRRWSKAAFMIPAGVLQKGENDIMIRNITEDTEKDGECGAAFVTARNYFWGWLLFDEILFEKVK